MIAQSKGKMYLADERGLSETYWFRSLHTFNFRRYQHEHKNSFGNLYVLNEDTLAEGKTLTWLIEEDSDVILLPVVGTIDFSDSTGKAGSVAAGVVQVLNVPAGATYEITNPYADQLIKCLQLWIKAPAGKIPSAYRHQFDLQNNQLNKLFNINLRDYAAYEGAIVKLNGRQEELYYKKRGENGTFLYVIQGAMEVQHRLMHEGDGLALWDADIVEFEALSNEAILLILEVPIQQEPTP